MNLLLVFSGIFFFSNVRCRHLNKTDQQEVESVFSRWVEYHVVSSWTKMHVRKCERCCSILLGDIKGNVLVNNNVISRSFSMERRWYANPNGFIMTFSRNTFPISFSVLFLTRWRIPHLPICILFFPSYSLRVLQFISDFFCSFY
jgi:hypothetical protein